MCLIFIIPQNFFCVRSSLILKLIIHFFSQIKAQFSKLMQLDRGRPEIQSKSYSNQLLIDFCNSIPAVRSIVSTISIRIWTEINRIRTEINWKQSIYIENSSILSKIGRIWA